MSLEETISDTDVVQNFDDLSIVYAQRYTSFMDDVSVDYLQTWSGKQLTIESIHAPQC